MVKPCLLLRMAMGAAGGCGCASYRVSRSKTSLIFVRNLFQLFQPMGGVRASPLSGRSLSSGSGSFGGGGRHAARGADNDKLRF